jgi:hypothetical protein
MLDVTGMSVVAPKFHPSSSNPLGPNPVESLQVSS